MRILASHAPKSWTLQGFSIPDSNSWADLRILPSVQKKAADGTHGALPTSLAGALQGLGA